jgi:catechol 2,3-dioxygenase-like lactoylglutathione lyase family enzyme
MLEQGEFVAMLPVADLDRAKLWYAETLGFEPESEDAGGAHYRTGSARFDLYVTTYAGTAQHTQAGWMVDDVDGAVAELREGGVVFEEYDFPGLKTVNGIADLGYERAAWFKDPDGNILAVSTATPGG